MAYEKKRVNVYLTPEVKDYYQEKAEEMAISMSAMMNIALKQQMDQDVMIKTLPNMIEKINELERQAKEKDSSKQDT